MGRERLWLSCSGPLSDRSGLVVSLGPCGVRCYHSGTISLHTVLQRCLVASESQAPVCAGGKWDMQLRSIARSHAVDCVIFSLHESQQECACCWAVRHRIVSKMVRRCPPIPGGRNAIVLLPYARDTVLQPQLPTLESRSAVRESRASSSARRTRQLCCSAPFGSRSGPTVCLGRWATLHYHCAI